MLAVLNALQQILSLTPLAAGVWLAFTLLRFPDLTFPGSFTLGAACFAATATRLASPIGGVAALMAALAVGGATGALTSVLNTRLRVPSLLAGIAVSSMCYTAALLVMHGPTLSAEPANTIAGFVNIPQARLLSVDLPERLRLLEGVALLGVFVLLVIVIGCLAALRMGITSRIGLLVRAAGSNPKASARYGLRPQLHLGVGLAAANMLAALSGGLFAQHVRFADVTFGTDILTLALGAVVVSEAFLRERATWSMRLAGLVASIGLVVAVRFTVLRTPVGSDYVRLLEGLVMVAAIALSARARGRAPLQDLRL